jgi:transcriptional regulator with XRE-family HTH domain
MQISQEELGKRADLHRTYICDVERGARNLSLSTLERIADALGIPAWEILFLATEEAKSRIEPE